MKKEIILKLIELYYAVNHLIEHLSNIPSYQTFNNRLNNLHEAFRELTSVLTSIFTNKFSMERLPVKFAIKVIVLAKIFTTTVANCMLLLM